MKKKNIKTVMMLLILTGFANSYVNLGAMMQGEDVDPFANNPTSQGPEQTQSPKQEPTSSFFGRLKSGAQAGWASFKSKLPGSKTPEPTPAQPSRPVQQAQPRQGIRVYISEKWANWNSLDKKIDNITESTKKQLVAAFSLLNNQLKVEKRLKTNEYQDPLNALIADLNWGAKRLEPSLRRYVAEVSAAKNAGLQLPPFKLKQTELSW